MKAVGIVTDDSDKHVGRITVRGKKGEEAIEFTLSGMDGGTQYRYTMVTVHRNDVTKKSEAATAGTVAVKSEATAPGKVTSIRVDTDTQRQLTITATPPSDRGKKADGSTDVKPTDIKYELYYARVSYGTITVRLTAYEIRRTVGSRTADADAGKVSKTGDTGLRTGFEGIISSNTIYRCFIRSINPDDDTDSFTFDSMSAKQSKQLLTVSTNIKENAYVGTQNIRHLIISEGVTSIGRNAFYDTDIAHLGLPSSIQRIDDGAFINTRLISVYIHYDLFSKIGARRSGIFSNIDGKRILFTTWGESDN